MALTWSDVDDIAIELYESAPDYNPLQIRFTDLIDRILSLPDFAGERDKCNEKILEAIQMSWLEEFNDAQAQQYAQRQEQKPLQQLNSYYRH